jgi:GAF domain-containing protein
MTTGPDGDADADARRAAGLDLLVALAVRLQAADRIAPPRDGSTLQAIAEVSAAVMRVMAVSVALHDPASGRLVFRVAAGPQGGGVIGLDIAAHEGIAGYVHSTGQPLAVADVGADPRFERTTAERTGYVPRSLLAVPLDDADGPIGVMEFLDRRDGVPFDLTDLETGRRFASAVSASVRATRLDHDAVGLFAATLAAFGAAVDPGSAASSTLDEPAIDALVAAVADRLEGLDPLWRLADRIGRLREADADSIDLANDWLDALLAHQRRRGSLGR